MIQISNMSKSYGPNKALVNLHCRIQKGMMNGLVGPNGSGKTTLIHCILNQLDYQGEIHWNHDHCTLFFIPDENILPDLLSGFEYLQFIESLYKTKNPELKSRLLEDFDLLEEGAKPMNQFSYGMKKKIQIIGALIVNPDILILDEIFRGLDMKAILDTKRHLLDYVRKGNTVLLSSHDILSIEQLCQSVIFLVKGELKAYGSPYDLLKQFETDNLENLFVDLMQCD